jgi:hypothetical protein
LENPLVMPDEVHGGGGVFAVMKRKGGVEADLFSVLAQQSGRRCRSRFRPRSARRP